jgi:hypothetical protein
MVTKKAKLITLQSDSDPLGLFIRRKGGINECAARFSRRFGREVKQRRYV